MNLQEGQTVFYVKDSHDCCNWADSDVVCKELVIVKKNNSVSWAVNDKEGKTFNVHKNYLYLTQQEALQRVEELYELYKKQIAMSVNAYYQSVLVAIEKLAPKEV